MPVESLHRLAPDPDRMVRRVTAAHPRLLAEGLARLLVDPSESFASAAAGNPDLSSAAMHRILALAGL
ncbi:hypothetical protein OTB23_31765 [Streptomyces sp. H34-AA3]|nr:hypothetical protein [Streptomyces sp. H34-AA3]